MEQSLHKATSSEAPGGETQLNPDQPAPESRQKDARRYHRSGRTVGVARSALGFLFLAGVLFAGLSRALAEWVRTFAWHQWLEIAVFCAILFVVYEILSLPLDYYSGHRLLRRFGLSRQTPGDWLKDHFKGVLIGLLLGLVGFEILYWLLRMTDPVTFPLWAGLALVGFLILASWLFPVLLMPVFFKTQPVRDEELNRRLAELVHDAGAQLRGIFQFDLGRKSRVANAALTGLGKTRRILLSDTLLSNFTGEEIGVVLAHELAHHKRRHIPKLIAAQTVLGIGAFFAVRFALRSLAPFLELDGAADPAGLPLMLLVLGGAGFVAAPFWRSASRRLEAGCDDYALRATNDPESFISAMRKLAALNLAEESPSPWVERLFYSHPPIARRIEQAKKFRRDLSTAGG
ncbi:MAG: M48 family metallopeptidase [Nitrospinota bacterium]